MYCRSLVLLIRLFKCRLCCIDRMTCFVFDVCVISGECTSGKINHFITRQIINADSRSVSGKCIIQIIRRTAIRHTGIEFQTDFVICEGAVCYINPASGMCINRCIPAFKTAL